MVVGNGTELNRVITLGSDYYESEESISKHEGEGKPRIGIGEHCKIENAIIDKNARIGNNVIISPAGKPESVDHELYLHPRRHRHHSKKRRHPARDGDLNECHAEQAHDRKQPNLEIEHRLTV